MVLDKERPTSSVSDIFKEQIQTKSSQMETTRNTDVAASSTAGTELQNTRKRTTKPRSNRNARNNGDRRPWNNLPADLLTIILMGVTIADLFSFARVSRTWRALAISVKREFLDSQGPLVSVISSRAKRTCFFFDMKAQLAYRTMFPIFCGRICIGISSGFLILQSFASDLMLINPMTAQRVDFPKLLQFLPNHITLSDRCIFAYTVPQQGFLAVALCSAAYNIQFRRSGDSEWSLFSYASRYWFIRDIIAFRTRIYALIDNAHIGLLSLRSPPTMELLQLNNRPHLSPYAKLVASSNELLVIDFVVGRMLQIYRVDIAGSQWVRVVDLGNRSLFLSELKSSRICSTAGWGGRANCIYYIGYKEECLVFTATNRPVLVDRFPITPGNRGGATRVWYGWYMPTESHTMDSVWDDRFPAVAAA